MPTSICANVDYIMTAHLSVPVELQYSLKDHYVFNPMTRSQHNVPFFDYDSAESVDGRHFLTPVYFNRQVLTRYMYDSRFNCEFASETYGTVYGPEFSIAFGINRNGTVISWLGDLTDLPIREQYYWFVENKEPENEIASEFYEAQVFSKFTPQPAVIQCLNAVSKLNSMFHRRYEVHLYKDRSIEERIEETRRYKRLILNNADDLKRFISELNEIINENTNNTQLQHWLTSQGKETFAKSKGNKLLQGIYETFLLDAQNLIAPFYYLYDLRLWADHSTGDKYLTGVAKKLGVEPDQYQLLMDSLISKLTASADSLAKKVDA